MCGWDAVPVAPPWLCLFCFIHCTHRVQNKVEPEWDRTEGYSMQGLFDLQENSTQGDLCLYSKGYNHLTAFSCYSVSWTATKEHGSQRGDTAEFALFKFSDGIRENSSNQLYWASGLLVLLFGTQIIGMARDIDQDFWLNMLTPRIWIRVFFFF